jgi:hypothetical protein
VGGVRRREAIVTQETVDQLTALLRSDNSPFWSRHRECLRDIGINVNTSLLVQSFPADVDQELGVLVTEDSRVIEFELSYHRTGDPQDAVIARWEDITATWRTSHLARDVAFGLELLNGQPPP